MKSDGTRFTDGRTLKLEVNTTYVLHIDVSRKFKSSDRLLSLGPRLNYNDHPFKMVKVQS